MTTYFVSRHPGARDWINSIEIHVDRYIEHLEISNIKAGDLVIGNLTINLAAEVRERGARYMQISLDLPVSLRGRELSVSEMKLANARLQEYKIFRIDV